MKKLLPGDKIKLFGGYDMALPWLKGHEYYLATVLRFIDNKTEGRKDDERLSAFIEFSDEVEFNGFKGKYGYLTGRWEGQRWETKGVVHVQILSSEIIEHEEITREKSRWVESHASYKKTKC
jgi:hypothetical protein